jgi:hypothetical protein
MPGKKVVEADPTPPPLPEASTWGFYAFGGMAILLWIGGLWLRHIGVSDEVRREASWDVRQKEAEAAHNRTVLEIEQREQQREVRRAKLRTTAVERQESAGAGWDDGNPTHA